MADAQLRIIIGFESAGGTAPTGWSETWYPAGSNADDALIQAKAYVAKRKELLGMGATVQFAKVTNIPPNRQSKIYFFEGKEGTPTLFTGSGDQYDPTQVDLLMRVQSTTPAARRQWAISGLPDSVTNQLIQSGVKDTFVTSPIFKQLIALIKSLGWGIRKKTANGPPPVFTFASITDIFPIMVRNRKRGRPFELFRGRRLA